MSQSHLEKLVSGVLLFVGVPICVLVIGFIWLCSVLDQVVPLKPHVPEEYL